MTPLNLFGSVGYDEDNDSNDVANTGAALASLGHLDALESARSGVFVSSLDSAIRTYQSNNDLEADGVLLAKGPTQQSLNEALKAVGPRPSLLSKPEKFGDLAGGPAPDGGDNHFEGPAKILAPSAKTWPTAVATEFADESNSARCVPKIAQAPDRNWYPLATPASRVAASSADLFATPTGSFRNAAWREQNMKYSGYRYIPDPMGRIGQGDWVDEQGQLVSAEKVREMATGIVALQNLPPHREPGDPAGEHALGVLRSRSTAPRRIESNFERLAYDLDAASAEFRGGRTNVRIALTLPSLVDETADGVSLAIRQINGAVREAVVANALRHQATSRAETAWTIKSATDVASQRPQTSHSRIKDMLIEAAANGSTDEQRLHAKGLLAVYNMEVNDAIARRDRTAIEKADAAINRFIADQAGEIPWAVYEPDQDNDFEIEPVDDAPSEKKKPRGMHNENTRAGVEQGKQRHREAHDVFRKRGWWADKRIPGSTLRPDAITKGGKPVEVKPDTETGRKAGEKQIKKYNQATGQRGRVIYYSPDGSYSGFRGGLGGPPSGGSPGRGPYSK